MCCNPANVRVDFEALSAFKIQLHGTELIVSLSANWDKSPRTKKNAWSNIFNFAYIAISNIWLIHFKFLIRLCKIKMCLSHQKTVQRRVQQLVFYNNSMKWRYLVKSANYLLKNINYLGRKKYIKHSVNQPISPVEYLLLRNFVQMSKQLQIFII